MALDFPLWVRVTHFFTILFITLLFRSGIEILGAHPKLYWNNDAFPGSEWLRFGDEERSPTTSDIDVEERHTDEEPAADGSGLWTAQDEEQEYSPWIALPGGGNLGLGRHWHFWAVTGWILTGIVYVVGM